MRDPVGRRRPLLLLAPATFFEGYDNFLLALALPLIRDDFGISVAQAGTIVTVAFAGSFGVLALLPLADRFGRRPLLAVTIAGYTIATVATGFSRGILDLAAFQFVARLFLGTEYALAQIVLVETLPADRRGRQLGILTSSATIGMAAAGAGFLAVFATGASWRLLYFAGAVPLLLVARARRALPETLPAVGDRRPRVSLRTVPRRHLAGSSALILLASMLATGVTAFASLLVLEEWGWGLSDLRPQYMLLWLAGLSGFFVAGRLMDTWGRRPTTVLFLLGASAAAPFAFTAGETLDRALGMALVIFTFTGATPCIAAYSTELFPRAVRGRAGAVLRAMSIAGSTAAPALVGTVADLLGSVGQALAWLGVGGAIAALVVVAALPETRGAAEAGAALGPPTPTGRPSEGRGLPPT